MALSEGVASPGALRSSVWGVLVSCGLIHVSFSIFWQFAAFHLFSGIGEVCFSF